MPAVAVAASNTSIPSPADLKAAMHATTPKDDASFNVAALYASDKAAREPGYAALVALVQKEGPSAFATVGFADATIKALADKKSPATREGAALAVKAVASDATAIKALEPTFVDSGLLAALLEAFADKMPAVRLAAIDAVKQYVSAMNPWACAIVLSPLLEQIKTAGKWQIKTGALTVLNQMVVCTPTQLAGLMPEVVPVLAEVMWDTKADVKKAAKDSLTKACALVSNKDIERFIPALISALINPVEEVAKTVELLGSTTFVSEVDSPTLSLMVPLLSRGLTEKLTSIKRKVAVITDNMSKLVDSPTTVRPFLPKLLPGLIKIENSIGDPEARGVVGKAIATLRQVGELPEGSDGTNLPPLKSAEPASLASSLASVYKKFGASPGQRQEL